MKRAKHGNLLHRHTKFTKDTIMPGENGFIDLTYNIKNKIGAQKLYAVVKANTEARFYKLTFKMEIFKD
ncbi:MAG: DUF1573 domain-containing protein [Prolixibacteraceae bacterium]